MSVMSDDFPLNEPDLIADCEALFGFDPGFEVPAFSRPDEHTPPVDEA